MMIMRYRKDIINKESIYRLILQPIFMLAELNLYTRMIAVMLDNLLNEIIYVLLITLDLLISYSIIDSIFTYFKINSLYWVLGITAVVWIITGKKVLKLAKLFFERE